MKTPNNYDYYYDDKLTVTSMPPRYGKSFRRSLNCSDEITPGSNKRAMKIRDIISNTKLIIGSSDFIEKYSSAIRELHKIMQEEVMGMLDCDEHQANMWIDRNVDFNHLKKHEFDCETYYTIDPIIGPKY